MLTLSEFTQKYSKHLSQTFQKDVVILSAVSSEKLHLEIKKYENICKNIKIIDIEKVLKNSSTFS